MIIVIFRTEPIWFSIDMWCGR